ncbi:MAG: hypothetical protein P8Q50_12785 [Octadecabacter sp.]|nr:hypothetical protein [Octadecabacter sp.]
MGTSFLADISVLYRVNSPLKQSVLDSLHVYHRIVTWALIGMWVTGGMLIYLRTGFIWENFSPKLIAKIVVVALLTLNSLMINVYIMPKLKSSIGTAPADMRLNARLPMSLVAGCWHWHWAAARS